MEESDTYGASGVLVEGGNWYLRLARCNVGSFVCVCVCAFFFNRIRVGIDKMDGLCVWVEV